MKCPKDSNKVCNGKDCPFHKDCVAYLKRKLIALSLLRGK